MKKLLVINVLIVVVAAILAVACFDFSKETIAQDSKAKPAEFKVAVVNFSKMMKQADDVIAFQKLLKLFNQLYQKTQESLQTKIKAAEDNLKAAQEQEDYECSQEYIEAQEQYLKLLAELETLKDSINFSKKKELVKFSSRFLEKVLKTIKNHAGGRYDIVYKVINPGEKDVENMDDAMQLQLDQAREILYYDEDRVADITDEIRRIVNNNNDKDVSQEIEKKKTELEKAISALK
ncbi:MAG: hypothetical protein K8S87_02560 [Planctomycetes bacterium]|nr:hypothetical protein [Planctomycetota bacterium]